MNKINIIFIILYPSYECTRGGGGGYYGLVVVTHPPRPPQIDVAERIAGKQDGYLFLLYICVLCDEILRP